MRLPELLVMLSLGADLGMGQPMEHALRQCVLALRVGERLGMSAAVFALASTAAGLVAGYNGDEVDDQLPGLRAQPQERAELVGGDAGITDGGQHFDLLLDQVGLILIVVAEEERRPDTESPRHRLDQALRRVGGLPVAQLPGGGVGDPLPSDLPDRGRDLGVAVGTAAGGMRCRDDPA